MYFLYGLLINFPYCSHTGFVSHSLEASFLFHCWRAIWLALNEISVDQKSIRQLCSSADAWKPCFSHVTTKTIGKGSFPCCAPTQCTSLPSDVRSFPAFKTALKTYLYQQYHKWFQILSSSSFPPPSPFHSHSISSVHVCVCVCVCVHVCVCVCKCVCMCVWSARNTMFIYYFLGFHVYIFVDLVNYGVLTLVGEIPCYRNDCYSY